MVCVCVLGVWGRGAFRKAGSSKLHPSKPGGTFVGSKARQVEVKMAGRGNLCLISVRVGYWSLLLALGRF